MIVINGVATKNGQPLRYDVSAVVTDSLRDRGRLVLDFRAYFSIEVATIQVGFKDQRVILDSAGNSITNTLSSPYPLDRAIYIDAS